MNLEILKELGLSEKEIKVYIAGLKLGIANVSTYAEKSSLPRTTTYDLLKSLKEKGLASYVVKSGVKYFSVTSPKELLEKLQEKEKRLKNILPELKSLHKTSIEKPQIEFYVGIEGFKTFSNDLLEIPNSTIYAYVAEKNLQFMPIFHLQFRRKRKERRIRIKVITEKAILTKELKEKDRGELRETRFLNGIMKNSITSFFIYGDKILHAIATEKEQFGVIIKNKNIAEFQKKIFNQIWNLVRAKK